MQHTYLVDVRVLLLPGEIHHGDNEIESVVRVGDNDKEGGFPVPQRVKLQIVRFHKLPQLFNVKGC